MDDDSAIKQPGDVIAGRYRVESLLGRGGFGVVYKAADLQEGSRPVALKMMLVAALAQEEGLARFKREAELAKSLDHPNTVRLFDFGTSEEGLPFIAWELLDGRPLDVVLGAELRLSPARVARIATQILSALEAAHALGIVHRDIKPGNVFLCTRPGEKDVVKIIDFGIAKDTKSGTPLTRVGSILGTPSYMAPEQVAGRHVTTSADLYSLGLVMAEALTGQVVYGGANGFEVCLAQLAATPAPLLPEVLASPLGPVIAKATQKAVADRFPSAAAMKAELESVSAGLDTDAVETKAAPSLRDDPSSAYANTVPSVNNWVPPTLGSPSGDRTSAPEKTPDVSIQSARQGSKPPPGPVAPTVESPAADPIDLSPRVSATAPLTIVSGAVVPKRAARKRRGKLIALFVVLGLLVSGGVTVGVLFLTGVLHAGGGHPTGKPPPPPPPKKK